MKRFRHLINPFQLLHIIVAIKNSTSGQLVFLCSVGSRSATYIPINMVVRGLWDDESKDIQSEHVRFIGPWVLILLTDVCLVCVLRYIIQLFAKFTVFWNGYDRMSSNKQLQSRCFLCKCWKICVARVSDCIVMANCWSSHAETRTNSDSHIQPHNLDMIRGWHRWDRQTSKTRINTGASD